MALFLEPQALYNQFKRFNSFRFAFINKYCKITNVYPFQGNFTTSQEQKFKMNLPDKFIQGSFKIFKLPWFIAPLCVSF